MNDKKLLAAILLTTTLTCAHVSSAFAGPNDFFGGPGGTSSPSAAAGAEAAQNALVDQAPQPGDFTDDEKRMQKKYQEKVKHAKSLIAKGELMMKKGEGKDDKAFKKGKVFKQIGERELAELQANNPFPDKDPKKDATGQGDGKDKQDEASKTEL